MAKDTPYTELQAAIRTLETRQEASKQMLIGQLKETYSSFKPLNIFKNALSQFSGSANLVSSVLELVFALAVPALSKKVPLKLRQNTLVAATGQFVRQNLIKLVVQNPYVLSTLGVTAFRLIKKFRPSRLTLRKKT